MCAKTILDGRSIILKASLLHETGHIVSKDKRIAKFFGYTKQEFNEIHNLQEILPRKIAEIHKSLIYRMLLSG